jgi:DNA-binding transcriptional ArsR family regulator
VGLRRFFRYELKGMDDFAKMIRRARVLSSPTRVALWNALGEQGRHPVELAREFGLAPSTVTFHMAELMRARLVKVHGHGGSRVYRWSGVKLGIISEAELNALMNSR